MGRDRDIARDEFGHKMNEKQSIKWIVDELRIHRQFIGLIPQVLHILLHAHPDAPLTPEQKAAIEAATQQIESSTNQLNDSVERNKVKA